MLKAANRAIILRDKASKEIMKATIAILLLKGAKRMIHSERSHR
jgi:hypothetical protein